MPIYTPYFYIIQDKRNGMYYAGAKWGQDANPTNFMIEGGYTTSSNIIKRIIEECGLSVFLVRKIRVFDTMEQTQNYETKFLRRINARKHTKFYNGHNNDGAMDILKMNAIISEIYGVEHPFQSEVIKSRIKDTMMIKYGVEHPMHSDTIKEKVKSTNIDRYGVENPFQSNEIKEKIKRAKLDNHGDANYRNDEKIKQTNIERYGVENVFQSETIKEKIKFSMRENHGVDNPMYSDEIKEKMKKNNLEKYGVSHYFQTKEFVEKMSENRRKKLSRPLVLILRKYQELYDAKFGANWSRKSDEFLVNLLEKTIEKYGNL